MPPPIDAYRVVFFANFLPFGNEKLEKSRGWVEIAVLASEKLYGAGNGDAKLAYAEKFLAEHRIKLDVDTLKAMINAEIKKMEQVEQTKQTDTIVTEHKIE